MLIMNIVIVVIFVIIHYFHQMYIFLVFPPKTFAFIHSFTKGSFYFCCLSKNCSNKNNFYLALSLQSLLPKIHLGFLPKKPNKTKMQANLKRIVKMKSTVFVFVKKSLQISFFFYVHMNYVACNIPKKKGLKKQQ